MSAEAATGAFEVRVFVAPLDPPADVVARFRAACPAAVAPTKALLLQLDYVGRGLVGAPQTSRDVTGDVAAARAAARADAEAPRAVISEHICFDSDRAVDDGRLEPLP